MVWRECQDKIKFSLIVSYNAAFNQKMLVINNRRGSVSIRQQVLYMLTDSREASNKIGIRVGHDNGK